MSVGSAQAIGGHGPLGMVRGLDAASAIRCIVAIAIAALFCQRILGGVDPTLRFFDDFFYYLKPAANLVDTGAATFFPGESTNGYHPLWFAWIVGLYALCGGANTAFFSAVDLSVALLCIAGFLLLERALFHTLGNRIAAVAGSGVAWIQMAQFAATGVEMALVACLVSAILWRMARRPIASHSTREAALIGFLGALAVLARTDALAIAPFLLIAVLGRWDMKRMTAAGIAAFPLYAYLAWNLATTGHLATTATHAKSIEPAFHLLETATFTLPLVWAHGLACLAGIGLLALHPPTGLSKDGRRLLFAVLAAPLAQFVLQDAMSGWYVFIWYLYLALLAVGVLAALVVARVSIAGLPRLAPFAACAGIAISASVGAGSSLIWRGVQWEIASAAQWIEGFARENPGVYAMGDAAGVPGWIVDQPMVHLEGLMMSHDFVERIQAGRPLSETLRDYGVTYLVSNRIDSFDDRGCPIMSQPHAAQASPRAAKMEMPVCVRAVAAYRPDRTYDVRIYRIDPRTGEAVSP